MERFGGTDLWCVFLRSSLLCRSDVLVFSCVMFGSSFTSFSHHKMAAASNTDASPNDSVSPALAAAAAADAPKDDKKSRGSTSAYLPPPPHPHPIHHTKRFSSLVVL